MSSDKSSRNANCQARVQSPNQKPKKSLKEEKKQALRSSCELLRTKDSKRFKKEQTGTFRNLQ